MLKDKMNFILGIIVWFDFGKGGWLMYCLYYVLYDVINIDDDLLIILICVCGKMVWDMEMYCFSIFYYDKVKFVVCVYY